jgi:hypothetical protein
MMQAVNDSFVKGAVTLSEELNDLNRLFRAESTLLDRLLFYPSRLGVPDDANVTEPVRFVDGLRYYDKLLDAQRNLAQRMLEKFQEKLRQVMIPMNVTRPPYTARAVLYGAPVNSSTVSSELTYMNVGRTRTDDGNFEPGIKFSPPEGSPFVGDGVVARLSEGDLGNGSVPHTPTYWDSQPRSREALGLTIDSENDDVTAQAGWQVAADGGELEGAVDPVSFYAYHLQDAVSRDEAVRIGAFVVRTTLFLEGRLREVTANF